ncbi:MAG: hypothetical protein HQL31_03185, partial [Planctomycetes bacterium]|nr:hypothetical protein [Planctomycetota bacterium]
GPQSGAWSACGVGSPERLERDVFQPGFDHGVSPTSSGYAYMVEVGVPKDHSTEPGLEAVILSNTADSQAVWQAGLGQAVFYQPGQISFPDGQVIAADRPCALIYKGANPKAVVTLGQPAEEEGMLRLELSGPLAMSAGIPFPGGSRAGMSVTIELGRTQ